MTTRTDAPARIWDPRTDRRAYVAWFALVAVALMVGFGGDVARYIAERPAPPLILHLHGFVFVAWLVLVGAQIFLVEKGNIRLHRTLGWATVIVAAAMIPFGVAAAMVDEARRLHQPDSDPQFLALEFNDVIAFTIMTIAGVLYRRDPAAHKRLMILSAVAISDAGFGRISTGLLKVTPTEPFTWWLSYYGGVAVILVAMILWDRRRRGRVHLALIGGAAVFWTGEAIAAMLFFTPGWRTLMTGAVKGWGWTG